MNIDSSASYPAHQFSRWEIIIEAKRKSCETSNQRWDSHQNFTSKSHHRTSKSHQNTSNHIIAHHSHQNAHQNVRFMWNVFQNILERLSEAEIKRKTKTKCESGESRHHGGYFTIVKIPPHTVPGCPLRISPPRFIHSAPSKMSCIDFTPWVAVEPSWDDTRAAFAVCRSVA